MNKWRSDLRDLRVWGGSGFPVTGGFLVLAGLPLGRDVTKEIQALDEMTSKFIFNIKF